jgi:hypothetical protein
VQFDAPLCAFVQFDAPSCNPVYLKSPKIRGGGGYRVLQVIEGGNLKGESCNAVQSPAI